MRGTITHRAGAAGTCIALATGSIRQILAWLDRHGRVADVRDAPA